MIDSNKLLSNNQVSRDRNIVTIKRNLIKINNLLKERLVLTKVRQGIMMQEEENRIRRQSEDDLESLEPTRKIEDDKPKDDKKNSGLLAALATLGLLFLPGLKKLLNFLNDIKDRVGNMAKSLLKAMTDFKDKAFAFLNKVNLVNFDKEKIQTTFAKFEKSKTSTPFGFFVMVPNSKGTPSSPTGTSSKTSSTFVFLPLLTRF